MKSIEYEWIFHKTVWNFENLCPKSLPSRNHSRTSHTTVSRHAEMAIESSENLRGNLGISWTMESMELQWTSSNPWVSSMFFFEMPRDFWGIPIFHPHPEIIEIASEHATTIKNDRQKSPLDIYLCRDFRSHLDNPTIRVDLTIWTPGSIWVWVNTYENTIFSGMNIHLPAILMWTTGVQGFDTLPYLEKLRLIPQSNSLTRNLDLSYHVISLFRCKLGGPLLFFGYCHSLGFLLPSQDLFIHCWCYGSCLLFAMP